MLSWLLGLAACSPQPGQQLAKLGLPAETRQVLLVTTADWQATEGNLQRFALHDGQWQAIGSPIPVKVGRNGMAWGLGLHQAQAGEEKREGDGKAPAGIFRLGVAFGYTPEAPAGVAMPYRQATEYDYWVDAPASPDYNQWRTLTPPLPNDPKQHWTSFERMRRDDHQYELGLVVEHNTQPVVAGRGSAIFMHIWLDPHTPTSGCTAMQREDLLTVLQWLQPQAKPVLVQLPQPVLQSW